MQDLILFIPGQYFWLATTTGFLCFLSLFYYLWVLIVTPKQSSISPPEAEGAWPVVGHLPQLVGSTPLFKILGDMSEKYGPIFMVRFGMYPTLVVSSPEMSKECFTTNDRFLASRPQGAAEKHLTFAMFAFSSYGPYWNEIRKISMHQLLSPRRLLLSKHVQYSEIDNCTKRLYKRWMKSQNQASNSRAADSVKVDMTQVFGELTLIVALKMVVGKRLIIEKDNDESYTAEDNYDIEEVEGQKLYKSIIEFFILAGATVASDVLPFLGWLDIDGQKKQMKRVAKEMDLFAEKWLEEHRQKKRQTALLPRDAAEGDKQNDAYDFMDVLISALDEEEDELFFCYTRDTVIKATCLNLVMAARDTTSVALTWALSLLLTNPGILKKAQDELDGKVGMGRKVQESDIIDLVYLQAIVKETLRLYPPTPLSLPHKAMKDCKIGGYEVKAGTRLLVNLWKLHRDPHVWSDPLVFKPERFLPQADGAASNIDFRGQHFEFTPFGSGRRMCPGTNFAIETLHMTLARLLHGFNFTNEGLKIDMEAGPGLTMPRVTPLEIHLSPRLPVILY